jgi:hypothetical protein
MINYKYPSVLQPGQIQHTTTEKQLTTALTIRLHKILKTNLNSKTLKKAISTSAILTLTYSYTLQRGLRKASRV